MAIGGLGAIWVYKNNRKLSPTWLFNKKAQFIIIGLLLYYLSIEKGSIQSIEKTVYTLLFDNLVGIFLLVPCLFLYLIINLSINSNTIFTLENRIFNYLGNISYGFYMYHTITMNIAKKITISFLYLDAQLYRIIFYTISFALTILAASLSYHIFEKRFYWFRLKN